MKTGTTPESRLMATITRLTDLARGDRSPAAVQAGASIAVTANVARNAAGGGLARRRRWRPAREALWAVFDRYVPAGATVGVLGAGNGDDLPLRRMARRAGRVDLIDLDPVALRGARRAALWRASHVHSLVEDVTGGAADSIIRRALGEHVRVQLPAPTPIGSGFYDVLVTDLMLTQMLYPALVDSGLGQTTIKEALFRDGQPLTDAVVARLHASTPTGLVVHVHDVLGWWEGHPQPFTIKETLAVAPDPPSAAALLRQGHQPSGCDPRQASQRCGAQVIDTAYWRWPFATGTDYLVCATVARSAAQVLAGVACRT